MKNSLFCIISIMFFFSASLLSQENPAILKRLNEKYESAWFSDGKGGRYNTRNKGKYGLCDLSGKEIIAPDKYTFVCLHDGWIGINIEDKAGACDLSGREIIAPDKYTRVSFHDDWFKVKVGDKVGACDSDGNEVVPCLFASVIRHNGIYKVKDTDNEKFVTYDVDMKDVSAGTSNTMTGLKPRRGTLTSARTDVVASVKRKLENGNYDEAMNILRIYIDSDTSLSDSELYQCALLLDNLYIALSRQSVKVALSGDMATIISIQGAMSDIRNLEIFALQLSADKGNTQASQMIRQMYINAVSSQTMPSYSYPDLPDSSNSRPTSTCSMCNGTGMNPAMKRPAFYDYSTEDYSSGLCKVCGSNSNHYHEQCPSCGGNGYR